MRYACRKDLHERCPGRWCDCECHQSTDQEPKIADHPFTPAQFRDAWPGICGHEVDGLPCGYSEDEHEQLADPQEVAATLDAVLDERLEGAAGGEAIEDT